MELGKYVEGVKSMTRTQWAPRAFDTLSLAFAAFAAGS
jgi:hypothetical protein